MNANVIYDDFYIFFNILLTVHSYIMIVFLFTNLMHKFFILRRLI